MIIEGKQFYMQFSILFHLHKKQNISRDIFRDIYFAWDININEKALHRFYYSQLFKEKDKYCKCDSIDCLRAATFVKDMNTYSH